MQIEKGWLNRAQTAVDRSLRIMAMYPRDAKWRLDASKTLSPALALRVLESPNRKAVPDCPNRPRAWYPDFGEGVRCHLIIDTLFPLFSEINHMSYVETRWKRLGTHQLRNRFD